MKKLLKIIAILIVAGGLGYYFRAPLGGALARLESRFLPCWQPISYSLGTFDARFGLSQKDFLAAVGQAEAIWEKPIAKNLFEYSAGGYLKMNLIYDNRQAATQKLQQLGIAVDSSRASYDALKAQYNAMQAEYKLQKAQYETEVSAVNQRGGADKDEFRRLSAERDALNSQVDTLNAMVSRLNDLAATLNLNVERYNTIGSSNGEEFNEGLYVSDASGTRIDIYQYDSKAKLVRVLAHEFGHALGLDHVDDPKAIMYRLNQAANEKLSGADLSALKARCAVE